MAKRSLRQKRYWLIGASAGIGEALAVELDRRGASLVLSARSADKLNAVASGLSNAAEIVVMDVTDQDSVRSAIDSVGPIDGVIYMAGSYTPMTAQDWQQADALAVTDTNFLGAMRVLPDVVSKFVNADMGHIVLIGSLAGFSGLPGAIGYGASKAALMHLAENLHTDLKATNVVTQVVNPGFVKTRLTDKNDFRMPFIQTPEQAAKVIANHMQSRRFSRSFPPAFAWFFKLRAIWSIVRG